MNVARSAQSSILCICTGNICRSPAAERLLVRALGPGVAVSSAGTRALVGRSFSPPMGQLVVEGGADAEGFAARQLSETHLREADLVLGMTREHRAAAVELVPAAVRRTFTLREYARLLTGIDPDLLGPGSPADRVRASLPLAAAQRRQASPAEDDIVDPYGQPDEVYATAFSDIDRAVRSIAAVLSG
jgi:protein-tyrosine phosphatase